MQRALGLLPEKSRLVVHRGEVPDAPVEEGLGEAPGALWNEDGTRTAGGRNFAEPQLEPSSDRSDEGHGTGGSNLAGPLLDPSPIWSDEDDGGSDEEAGPS